MFIYMCRMTCKRLSLYMDDITRTMVLQIPQIRRLKDDRDYAAKVCQNTIYYCVGVCGMCNWDLLCLFETIGVE